MRRALLPLLFSCGLIACASGPATVRVAAEPHTIDGAWVKYVERVDLTMPGLNGESFQLHGPVPGSNLSLELHTKGSQVSGTGAFAVEAGPRGTLTVSGTYQAPDLLLTITRDNGQVANYTAKVVSDARMDGILSYEGFDASETRFVRP